MRLQPRPAAAIGKRLTAVTWRVGIKRGAKRQRCELDALLLTRTCRKWLFMGTNDGNRFQWSCLERLNLAIGATCTQYESGIIVVYGYTIHSLRHINRYCLVYYMS